MNDKTKASAELTLGGGGKLERGCGERGAEAGGLRQLLQTELLLFPRGLRT